ncbi:site-specific DNA-methyltransferase, partial [Pectobacterium versatile]|uniref:site-specific DNA-methyltransferase n=1 Tax=Pectobacterium versatile TaxID=2488639 RepID=UPI001F33ED37
HRIISMVNERITEYSAKQKENAEPSYSIDALTEGQKNESRSSLSDISNDLFEIPGTTPNFRTELAGQLAELIPEAVADGKLDVEKLRELLADDVADSNERFGLFWPGKKRALRAAQAPTTATLKPDFVNSKEWDTTQNAFIEGDNLEVLKILQRHYHNKVKLIYIDPPYNTGKDFVYPDNYKEGLDSYLEWTRQVNAEGKKVSNNSETEGRYHSNWLNMMYPRLKLARNLLTDDGVIFISIDDHEQENLRKLCNEVFGEGNFLGQIVWKKKTNGNNMGVIPPVHDYIVVYARRVSDALDIGYPITQEHIEKTYSNPDDDPRGPWTTMDLSANHKGPYFAIKNPETGQEFYPSEGRFWVFNEIEVLRRITDGRIIFGKSGTTRPVQKVFAAERAERKIRAESWWDNHGMNEDATNEIRNLFGKSKLFTHPKPSQLLYNLAKIATNDNSIVLDFFAGSATTAHAVMQLNAEDNGKRRFIMVQLPEPTPEDSEARKAGFSTIADISRKRIELAGEKIKSDVAESNIDTGFRAYKLTDTNFTKWRVTSDIEPDKLTQHFLDLRGSSTDEASPDDLLTELLLKLGYSLNEHLSVQTIAGLDIHAIVGDVDKPHLLAYLNERTKPTLEQLRELVNAEPTRLIVLEDAFHGDDELKTNIAQYAWSKGIELRTV